MYRRWVHLHYFDVLYIFIHECVYTGIVVQVVVRSTVQHGVQVVQVYMYMYVHTRTYMCMYMSCHVHVYT